MKAGRLDGVEHLVQELGWRVESIEHMPGGYAAELYRLKGWDRQGEAVDAVYKRFSSGRAQELPLYAKIASALPYGLPTLYGVVEEHDEQGILMEASGVVLKPVFQEQGIAEQQATLSSLVRMFAELHATFADQGATWLTEGVISTYPYHSSETWAQDSLKQLAFLADTGLGGVTAETVQEIEAMIGAFYPRYPEWTSGRQTFTHGDPHMENILLDQGQLRLIDWEYASLALPQRDLSILLQDVLGEDLHTYALRLYQAEMRERGWDVDPATFAQGFTACLFDNTLMMLGWEIGKYRGGHLDLATLQTIVQHKLGWIRRAYDELIGS